MCDFSLHAVRSRPAKVGDKLTTRVFNSATRGSSVHPKTKEWQFAYFRELRCHLRIKLGGRQGSPGARGKLATKQRSSDRSTYTIELRTTTPLSFPMAKLFF
jgi:hypothetical protein